MYGDFSRGHEPDRKRGREYRRVLLQMGRPVLDSDVAASVDAVLGEIGTAVRGLGCPAGSPDLGFLVTPGRLLALFAEAVDGLTVTAGAPDAWLDYRHRFLGRYPALHLGAPGGQIARVTLPLLQPYAPAGGVGRVALWARVEQPVTIAVNGIEVSLAPSSPDVPERVELNAGPPLDPLEIEVPAGGAVWLFLLEEDAGAGTDPSFSVAPGSYHVDGLSADAPGGGPFPSLSFPTDAGFPWEESPAPDASLAGLVADLDPVADVGTRLVAYLEVHERHVTHVEDPGLLEEALGATDTSTRGQVVGQVKLARPTGALPETAEDTASVLRDAFEVVVPSGGELTIEVPESTPTTDPCALPEPAGYSGADNRLYRVEVHAGGVLSQVRLKWSRDNGSELFAARLDENAALVLPTGTSLAGGDIVEVLSHVVDLGDDGLAQVSAGGFEPPQRAVGQLAQLVPVEVASSSDEVVFTLVDPDDVSIPVTPDDRYGVLERSVLKLRRWHGIVDPQLIAGGGSPSPGPHPLEDGITIELSETGRYRPGQYWQYEARVQRENANGPWRRAPHGPDRRFAPLALLEFCGPGQPMELLAWLDERFSHPCDLDADEIAFAGGRVGSTADTVQEAIEDLYERPLHIGSCTVTVVPGDDLDAALAELPVEGGELCFQAGRYELAAPLVVSDRRRIVVHGAGPATVISAAGSEAALVFEDCTEIAVNSLRVDGGTAGSPAARQHLNGAITVVGGGEVAVSDCVITCPDAQGDAHGDLRQTQTCLTARGAPEPLRVRLERNRFDVGTRQGGVLLVDPAHAYVAANAVRVAGARSLSSGRVADEGIVVGGGAVGTVEILDNLVEEAIQGIHVGASGPAAGREAADAVLLSRNVVHARVPAAHKRERHAVFVGNARSVHVKDTIATLERSGPGVPTAVDAIRLYGGFGPFVAVRQTSVRGFTIGVRLKPIEPLPSPRMWLVAETMADGAGLGLKAPPSVQAERNYPEQLVVALSAVTLDPVAVTGGTASTGRVLLTAPAPASGVTVTLSSDKGVATVPASATLAVGETHKAFTVTTSAVSSDTTAKITATYAGASKEQMLTVRAARAVQALTLAPAEVTGGSSATGTVALSAPALPGGTTVTLTSDKAAATVPGSVTVDEGETQKTFAITTSAVSSDTSARIIATHGASSREQNLTVRSSRTLSSLTLNPSAVIGGGSSTGTVVLTAPALSGGATVTLSSDKAAATVPSSVTVEAGQTQKTFTITTAGVTSDTAARITATYGGVSREQTLSVQVPRIPNIVGMEYQTPLERAAVRGTITDEGFVVGTATDRTPPKPPGDWRLEDVAVTSQSPAAGSPGEVGVTRVNFNYAGRWTG